MRAILLAAGFGTRLLPLTKHLPKCLVRINDKPLLGIWIDKIIDSGLGPVLINTHYLSGAVVDFTKHNVHNKQLNIVYEQELLGTAGVV